MLRFSLINFSVSLSLLFKIVSSWGRTLVAVAVEEGWPLKRGLNKSLCMDCPPGQKNVAVVERWPLWRGGR